MVEIWHLAVGCSIFSVWQLMIEIWNSHSNVLYPNALDYFKVMMQTLDSIKGSKQTHIGLHLDANTTRVKHNECNMQHVTLLDARFDHLLKRSTCSRCQPSTGCATTSNMHERDDEHGRWIALAVCALAHGSTVISTAMLQVVPLWSVPTRSRVHPFRWSCAQLAVRH